MEGKIRSTPRLASSYANQKKPKKKFDIRDFGASAMGVIVAVATAWITIDWEHFTWSPNNIMVLALSGIIAIGGAISKIKSNK